MRPIWVSLLIWAGVLACIPVVEHGREWTEQWMPKGEDLSDEIVGMEDIDEIDTTILADVTPEEEYEAPEAVGLDGFFAALKGADTMSVRVAHYGDSQIEEDRITSILRLHLQDQYGGDGVGLIPMHQTIPTRTLRQRLYLSGEPQTVGGGPKRYLVFGPKEMRLEDKLYGPMGQVAVMDNELVEGSEDARLELTPLKVPNYKRAFRHSMVRLLADSSIRMTEEEDGVHLRGKGRVYGLMLDSKTGVHVDNIPMRGCLGTVFSEMDANQLRRYFRDENVRLIILQYGGNFVAGAKTEGGIRSAVSGLRMQVRLLRRLAPEASILFIGPGDMLRKGESGELETNPLVPYMDRLLAKMAEEEKIAYYSLYHAMGGSGSMLEWQEKGWAASDGVHFSQRGADKAGEELWEWLNQETSWSEEKR